MTAGSLKDLFERKRRALLRRPVFGRTAAEARGRSTEDLSCEIEEGPWRTRLDQPEDEGGTGKAPQPDQMMRASLVAGLATDYRLWGARLDVRIDDVEVSVLCESDARGPLGIEGAAIGWKRMVLDVRVTSRAPEADVRRVIETADRLSALLANLSPAIERVHRLSIGGTFRSVVVHAARFESGRQPAGSNEDQNRGETMKTTKILMVMVGLGSLTLAASARAESPAAASAKADIQKTLGFVPNFFARFPEEALPGAWQEMKTLQLNPQTALPGRTKELIGLGVAAQIPCRYCIVAHTEFARLNGASDTEIGEAVAMAALTRHWSAFINGTQTDETKFRGEIAKVIDNVKRASAAKGPAPRLGDVTDGNAAVNEASQMLGGYVPEFIRTFPEEARAGAWRAFRDVQLSPSTALSGKQKELVGLAVAAQIPCRFCVIAHTEFAKLNGASDAEIKEALGMASLTRELSTLLNGMQVDEGQFRRDVEHVVKGAKAAKKSPTKGPTTAQR